MGRWRRISYGGSIMVTEKGQLTCFFSYSDTCLSSVEHTGNPSCVSLIWKNSGRLGFPLISFKQLVLCQCIEIYFLALCTGMSLPRHVLIVTFPWCNPITSSFRQYALGHTCCIISTGDAHIRARTSTHVCMCKALIFKAA